MFLADPLPDVTAAAPLPRFNLGNLAGTLSLVTMVPTLVLGLFWGPLAAWIAMRTW